MLVVVAHGSRNPAWCSSVERQIEIVQADIGRQEIQLAFMELSSPSLEEVVSGAVDTGENFIQVLPMFLASEGHVEKDVQPEVERLRLKFTSAEIELLPPLGQHPLFLAMLKTIATEKR